MRLAWPPPWHLTASALLCGAAIAMANLSPPAWQQAAAALAAVLAALVSGHIAVLCAFPGAFSLSMKWRIALIIISSALLSVLLSAVLSVTPRGLEASSLATILSLLTFLFIAIAYVRWSGQPRKRRFLFLPGKGMRTAGAWPALNPASPSARKAVLSMAVLAGFFAIVLAFSLGLLQIPGIGGTGQDGGAEGGLQGTEIASGSETAEESGSGEGTGSSISSASLQAAENTAGLADESSPAGSGTAETASGAGEADSSTFQGSLTGGSPSGGGSASSGSGSSSGASSSTASAASASSSSTSSSTGSAGSSQKTEKPASSSAPTSSAASSSGAQSSAAKLAKTETASASKNQSQEQDKASGTNLSVSGTNLSANKSQTAPDLSTADKTASPAPAGETSSSSKSNDSAISSFASVGTVTVNPKSTSSNGNQPPLVRSLTADKPSPQVEGVPVFWRVESEDEEEDRTVYQFLVNGKAASKWSKSTSWSWSTAGLLAGDYLITVRARDEKHAAEDSFDSMINASFTISAGNQPPEVLELKADRSSPQSTGSKITWTALASDPDGDGISYKFLKNGEDVTDWSMSEFWTWDTTSEKKGEYAISVQVRDGKHSTGKSWDASLESKFTLTVSNQPPAISALNAEPSGPYEAGDVITWSCDAADVEGDKILYKFLANGRVAQDWSSSAVWSWDTSSLPAGEYRIQALARDGKHAGQDSSDSSKEASVTLSRPTSGSKNSTGSGSAPAASSPSNTAPVPVSLKPDKASPQVQGETVVWTAEAEDGDSDGILYKFQLNGRDMTRWSGSPSWKWSTAGLADGEYRVRVLIRDGNHAPESSYDGSLDSTFTLISEIDQQIEELMKKRSGKSQVISG